MANKLRCMFAFAIRDSIGGEVFLARDRLGIKPRYYYNDGQLFVPASEVKAIFASGLRREKRILIPETI